MSGKTLKLLAALLVIIMAVGSAVPVCATSPEAHASQAVFTNDTKGTITMNNADVGDKYYAYKILGAVYDEDTNVVSYEATADFKAFLESDENSQKEGIPDFDAYLLLENDSAEMKQITGDYSAYCIKNSVTANYTLDVTEGSKMFPSVDIGQYVVNGVSATAKTVLQVMTASYPVTVATEGDNKGKFVVSTDVTITVKKNQPSIDKSIPSADVQYSIGEYVDYQIITTVPTYPAAATRTTYIIGDKCDDTLTYYYGGSQEGITGIVVKASTTGADNSYTVELTDNDHYVLGPKDDHEFVLTFDYDKIKQYKSIQVLYYAKVNSSAVVADPLNNTARLTYSIDPYNHSESDGVTIEDKETVYTYGFEVTKVDAEDDTKTLEGIEFALFKSGETEKIKFVKTNSTYTVADPEDTEAVTTTTLTTDADGKFNIVGLDVGDYEMRETKAYAGYSLPMQNFELSIKDDNKDGSADGEEGAETDSRVVSYTIENTKATTNLPETGGVGTLIFIIVGLAGMTIAVVALAILKKKSVKAN